MEWNTLQKYNTICTQTWAGKNAGRSIFVFADVDWHTSTQTKIDGFEMREGEMRDFPHVCGMVDIYATLNLQINKNS